jgi:hypothetical protein
MCFSAAANVVGSGVLGASVLLLACFWKRQLTCPLLYGAVS